MSTQGAKRIYTRVRHDFKYWFIGGGYTKLYNINLGDPRAFFERGEVVGVMITVKLLIWNIEIYFYKPMIKIMAQGAQAMIRFKPSEQSGQDKEDIKVQAQARKDLLKGLDMNTEYLLEQDNRLKQGIAWKK